MATNNLEPTLGYEMELSANDGNLAQLQTQLAHWEAGITGNSCTQEDYLGFRAVPAQKKEVFQALGHEFKLAKPLDLIYIMLNRLMIQASRRNQVNVIRYLLEDRKWPVSRIAVGRAMETDSYDVLELFLEHGWDINEPVKENHCTILRQVVNYERRVRWCLEHGADPNARGFQGHIDVLSFAAEHGSVQTLRLLAAHGGNFCRSNALHRAAEYGRVDVLEWLLDEAGFPVNQREYEYYTHYRWTGETALHYAVQENTLRCVRVLLQRGANVVLRDAKGRTAKDVGLQLGHEEVVKMLDEGAIYS